MNRYVENSSKNLHYLIKEITFFYDAYPNHSWFSSINGVDPKQQHHLTSIFLLRHKLPLQVYSPLTLLSPNFIFLRRVIA